MKKFAIWACLTAALGAGCSQAPTSREPGKLRVGLINTERIVQEMPKYQDLRNSLAKERGSFIQSLPEKPTQADYDRVQKEAAKKQSEWEKRVMETMQQLVKEISQLTAEVAHQKDLDLVLINTPSANSIYYHSGQDITIDVLLKLHK